MTARAERPAPSSVLLHWLVAFAIIGMMALGFYVSSLPRGQLKTDWVQLHKSFGMLVFALALIRLSWRFKVGFPKSIGAGWEARVAKVSHWLLLAATLFMPISGVVRSISYARPIAVFGVPVVPQLLSEKNEPLNEIAGGIHDTLAWVLLALVVLHVCAALKHHFVDRDDTLRRMSPHPARSIKGGV